MTQNKDLNEQLDRVHNEIRKEERVRKEFVDVISNKIKDIATPKTLDIKKRIRIPIFKREQGDNPETHILRTVYWFEELKIDIDSNKCTLDGDARQWLDDIISPATWDDLSTQFKKRFSTKDRLIRHLHKKWFSFSFDPSSDDIEIFIRDVKATANQLGHGNDSILNLIKVCMPTEIYGTLYSITDLGDLIKMVRYLCHEARYKQDHCHDINNPHLAPCSQKLQHNLHLI